MKGLSGGERKRTSVGIERLGLRGGSGSRVAFGLGVFFFFWGGGRGAIKEDTWDFHGNKKDKTI